MSSFRARYAAESGRFRWRERVIGGKEAQELRHQSVGWAIHALQITQSKCWRQAEAGATVGAVLGHSEGGQPCGPSVASGGAKGGLELDADSGGLPAVFLTKCLMLII